MKVAFISETNYLGKWPTTFANARTEIAWQIALDSEHYPIHQYVEVKGYDHVFIIFPKGKTFLNAEGTRILNERNPVSNLLGAELAEVLKKYNKAVYYVQEGPHWLYNDYELVDQIHYYNLLSTCDGIFAHNESDVVYYKGLFPGKPVHVIPTLMIEETIKNIVPTKQNKVVLGGNFARWYGGFESYIVAKEFEVPIFGQSSHARREKEEELLNTLPRLLWVDWIKTLSEFRYAVHLMPTVAAGTFSLNCAYLGIPCIGNLDVDTQRLCHPELAVRVNDVQKARELATKLKTDQEFYVKCSVEAKENYRKYYDLDLFKYKINSILR